MPWAACRGPGRDPHRERDVQDGGGEPLAARSGADEAGGRGGERAGVRRGPPGAPGCGDTRRQGGGRARLVSERERDYSLVLQEHPGSESAL